MNIVKLFDSPYEALKPVIINVIHIVNAVHKPMAIASIERVSIILDATPFFILSPNRGCKVEVTFNCSFLLKYM